MISPESTSTVIKVVEAIDLLVPNNFAMVEEGVYRSSFPRTKNIGFLTRLGLKTGIALTSHSLYHQNNSTEVISLVPEEYPVAMVDFYRSAGITLLSHGLEGNKWPFKEINEQELRETIIDILKDKNRPLLIHCNKGKHRTGQVGSLYIYFFFI